MSIPILPESAPFSPDQRAWLNGFFAGILNLNVDGGVSVNADTASAGAVTVQVEEDDDFPWHDSAMPMAERLELAQNKPFPRVLMAAMAQLDCGSCGYVCKSYAEAIASGADTDISKCSPGGKETKNKLKELLALRPADSAAVPAAAPKSETPVSEEAIYNRDHPFPAPILEVRPLTRKDSQKDVRFVSFGLKGSGLEYEVGDALGVYPKNADELCHDILSELQASGEEPTHTPEGRIVPARIALESAYVVNRVSEEFLEALSGLAHRDDERERLIELAETDSENYLEGRDVLDVLHDFPSARPTRASHVGFLISKLAPLRSRLYSISSSLKAHPDEVHLTVGVVRYGLKGNERLRKGVASTFLTERCVAGDKVGVFVHKAHAFGIPNNADAPLIMVGPGTGIAPFRAFIEERVALGHAGKNWLFFGDQRRETDYLYQSEIENYVAGGKLHKLDLAFSRDQAEKVYVQHKMLENGAELWKWLDEGGHFTVCGDASRMAKDVDRALHQIIEKWGGKSEDNAKEYVLAMSKEGRYARDVY